MKGSLLCLGTGSDVGKTTTVTGLCRVLARNGIVVAPFKAQNMSLHSFVTAKNEEIGRAQAMQALAAGIQPEACMNPILLKPGTDTRSQVVVMGHPSGDLDGDAWQKKRELLDLVVACYDDLTRRFDVVLCEGAGSPAEINLRDSDIVNCGFARARDIPAILVGDINPGGVFAAFIGTLALLAPTDQDLIRGFIVNKFRGTRALLELGLQALEAKSGRPTLGILPFASTLGFDTEDAIDQTLYADPRPPYGNDVLRIMVIHFPRASNLTDFDPLAIEAGVVVRFITRPEEMTDADLVVLPGTRSTVSDLDWLRDRGFPAALEQRVSASRPILGICGGYQMLGRSIDDTVESGRGVIDGLGLLPIHTVFQKDKVLAQRACVLDDAMRITGYEIHHGRVEIDDGPPWLGDVGCQHEAAFGTTWHGLFESDVFRRSFLQDIALRSGRAFKSSPHLSFAASRLERIETLADLLEEHLDLTAIVSILEKQSPRPPRLYLSLRSD